MRSCSRKLSDCIVQSSCLGKHSGRHALKAHLEEMGYDLNQEELNSTFERYKELADKKKTITDADLEALIEDQTYLSQEIFSLDGLQVACGTMGMPTATVRLLGPDGQLHIHAAVGTGPVHAVYQAVDAIIGVAKHISGVQHQRRHGRDRRFGRGLRPFAS